MLQEMKHGPIALLSKAILSLPWQLTPVYDKISPMAKNLSSTRRHDCALATEGDQGNQKHADYVIPTLPKVRMPSHNHCLSTSSTFARSALARSVIDK